MIRTTLDCDIRISLAIWRVERFVCGWPSWLCTSSSTDVTFSSVRACFGLLLPCRRLVLPDSRTFLCNFSSPPFFQFFSGNSVISLRRPCPLYRFQFFINTLSSLLIDMIHFCYFCHKSQIIIYKILVCFCLQTSEVYLKLNTNET